jgi:hypothetical protein
MEYLKLTRDAYEESRAIVALLEDVCKCEGFSFEAERELESARATMERYRQELIEIDPQWAAFMREACAEAEKEWQALFNCDQA